MNSKIYKKIISGALLVSMAFSLCGCDLLKMFDENKINNVVEDFFASVMKGEVEAFQSNSKTEFDIITLDDEQAEFFALGMEEFEYEIASVNVADSRKKATVKIELHYLDVADDLEATPYGTVDEYEELFDDCKNKKKTVKLTMKKTDDGWMFEDLETLYEMLVLPYGSIVLVDEDGNPVNPSATFYRAFMIDSVWYDAVYGNPATSDSVNSTVALQHVFYFTKPFDVEFTFELVDDDDEVVFEDTVVLEFDNTAVCDVDASEIDESEIPDGEYRIILYFDDEVVYESSEFEVG